jgi:hypothetical protein
MTTLWPSSGHLSCDFSRADGLTPTPAPHTGLHRLQSGGTTHSWPEARRHQLRFSRLPVRVPCCAIDPRATHSSRELLPWRSAAMRNFPDPASLVPKHPRNHHGCGHDCEHDGELEHRCRRVAHAIVCSSYALRRASTAQRRVAPIQRRTHRARSRPPLRQTSRTDAMKPVARAATCDLYAVPDSGRG